MPDLEFYRELAAKHGGAIFLWIDQSSDRRIKAKTLEGVCFALAREYVWSYQAGGFRKFDFINSIPGRGFNKSDIRIPELYISLQATYTGQLRAWSESQQILRREIKEAKTERKQKLLQDYQELKEGNQKTLFGKSYDEVKEVLIRPEKMPFANKLVFPFLQQFLDKDPKLYLLLTLAGGKESVEPHTIGFGFRPDIHGEKFNGFYQYFDANFGLLTFGTKDGLKSFFEEEIYLVEYLDLDYRVFQAVSFKILKH